MVMQDWFARSRSRRTPGTERRRRSSRRCFTCARYTTWPHAHRKVPGGLPRHRDLWRRRIPYLQAQWPGPAPTKNRASQGPYRALPATGPRSFCWKEKGSNATPSEPDACNTKARPHNRNPEAPDPLFDYAPKGSNHLTTDSSRVSQKFVPKRVPVAAAVARKHPKLHRGRYFQNPGAPSAQGDGGRELLGHRQAVDRQGA